MQFFLFLTIFGVQKRIKGAKLSKNGYIGYLQFKLLFSLLKFAPVLMVKYLKNCKFWFEDPIKITPMVTGGCRQFFF